MEYRKSEKHNDLRDSLHSAGLGDGAGGLTPLSDRGAISGDVDVLEAVW